jgi:hypothetical protein
MLIKEYQKRKLYEVLILFELLLLISNQEPDFDQPDRYIIG